MNKNEHIKKKFNPESEETVKYIKDLIDRKIMAEKLMRRGK